MKKYFKFFLLFISLSGLFLVSMQAQGVKRQSIGCYGTAGVSVGGALISQTIGQPFSTNIDEENGLLIIPGYQQPQRYDLAINDAAEKYEELRIYPIPASTIINILPSFKFEDAYLKITDISGKEKLNIRIPDGSRYVVDCSGWDSGIYFISVYNHSKEEQYQSKVIITK
ncbi:MAG TPA: T9SS type A sorting domain-containing protein [Bacteroidales bacterium]|nr:T9SS type A sorting domain-containing protein [Bacteroidales bacterium]